MSGNGNITAGFIDLATLDCLEKFLYASSSEDGAAKGAITYFVRQTQVSTWFSQVPVTLTPTNGTAAFGTESWGVNISRAGDYLLYAWLRVTIPKITLNTTVTGAFGPDTRNQMDKKSNA